VEDYEFGYRLMEKGYTIQMVREIKFKHHYADLFTFFKKCLRRVKLWVLLKKSFNRDFDDHGTSRKVAWSQIVSFLTLISAIGIIFNAWFSFVCGVLLIVLFALTDGFWKLIFAKKEGFLFVLYALLCYLVLSIPVVTGAALGYLLWFSGAGKFKKSHELHSL
jgi:GT2 family glycosyltransferase